MICIKCRVSSHESHQVLTLSQKCKDLKRELDQFQRKQKQFKWQCDNLENCADKVKEMIHRQYSNIKMWFRDAYQKQIAEIDNVINAERGKYLGEQEMIQCVANLLSSYSHSSSFLIKSKEVLQQIKLSSVAPELTWRTVTYKGPEEQFMRFSEEIISVAEKLFGHCAFQKISPMAKPEVSAKKIIRSQSLVEIPTFTKFSQKPPSELYSQTSISNSLSSIQQRHLSTGEPKSLREDPCSSEVCLNVSSIIFLLKPMVYVIFSSGPHI